MRRPGVPNQRTRGDNEPERPNVPTSVDFARGLQELGFYSILDVKKVLLDLYAEGSKLLPSKAIQTLATQQSMFTVTQENGVDCAQHLVTPR